METETAFRPLTGTDDPRVVAFLEAWHENGRPFFIKSYGASYAAGHYDSPTGYAKHACGRRKYICLDCGTSGVFMVDKATGNVYRIRAYGKINRDRTLGNIETMTTFYRKATAANQQRGY